MTEPLSRRELHRRLAGVLAAAAAPLAGCAKPWNAALPHPARLQSPTPAGTVTVRFLGTSSILIQDGRTTILADGFVTRPNGWRVVFWRVAADEGRIDRVLTRLGVTTIDAVFTAHDHYDHALDAPLIAKKTGAVLLGSASTANLGRGACLPATQIDVVAPGGTRRFGDFELTFIRSAHGGGELAKGVIGTPLRPPAHASQWNTGTPWSVLIHHGQHSMLVHGTLGFRRSALQGRRADVVYLGIGSLLRQRASTIQTYWDEVVRASCARRVILVHWDDFFRSLDEPLQPSLTFRFRRVLSLIASLAAADCVDVVIPVLWEPTDPFADLGCR